MHFLVTSKLENDSSKVYCRNPNPPPHENTKKKIWRVLTESEMEFKIDTPILVKYLFIFF